MYVCKGWQQSDSLFRTVEENTKKSIKICDESKMSKIIFTDYIDAFLKKLNTVFNAVSCQLWETILQNM